MVGQALTCTPQAIFVAITLTYPHNLQGRGLERSRIDWYSVPPDPCFTKAIYTCHKSVINAPQYCRPNDLRGHGVPCLFQSFRYEMSFRANSFDNCWPIGQTFLMGLWSGGGLDNFERTSIFERRPPVKRSLVVSFVVVSFLIWRLNV